MSSAANRISREDNLIPALLLALIFIVTLAWLDSVGPNELERQFRESERTYTNLGELTRRMFYK